MNILESVIEIAAGRFDSDSTKLGADTQFRQLGADSLDLVDLVSEVEEKFDISVSDEEIDSLRTIADVVKLVEKYKNLR